MENKYLLILALLALLSGCSSMSREECKQADWYLKGVDDATQGFALDRVIDHGKACARINVVPDMKAYREGHAKGARLYCIPEKGYSEGRKGSAYNGICPVEREAKFLQAYHDGQELYNIQRNMDRIASDINNFHAQIDNNYNEIYYLKGEIVNSNSDQERRYKMRRIDDLEHEIRNLSFNADSASREFNLYQNDYRVVEDKHFRMGYLEK